MNLGAVLWYRLIFIVGLADQTRMSRNKPGPEHLLDDVE